MCPSGVEREIAAAQGEWAVAQKAYQVDQVCFETAGDGQGAEKVANLVAKI